MNLCKYVYLKEELNKKIYEKGYGEISIQEIYQINKNQAKQIAQGLLAMDILNKRDLSDKLKTSDICDK